MIVYVVWADPDPGYNSAQLLGVYSTREAAEDRLTESVAYDKGILEATVDAAVVEPLQ